MVILKITMISCSNQLKTSQLIQSLIRIYYKKKDAFTVLPVEGVLD